MVNLGGGRWWCEGVRGAHFTQYKQKKKELVYDLYLTVIGLN